MTDSAEHPAGPVASARQVPDARTIVALVHDGIVDAELAALAWVVSDVRVPLIVAAPDAAGVVGEEIAAALGAFVPPRAGRARLGATEVEGDPARDVLVTGTLSGGGLRRAIRGVARGFGLIGRISAQALDDALARFGDFSVGASPELIGRLGIVLVVGETPPFRVVAAHYLRPVARDAGGHIQHLPPAVVATWDAPAGRWDHFEWGLYPELAHRLGRRPGDVERDHAERTDILATLVRAGVLDAAQVTATIAHAHGHSTGHSNGNVGRPDGRA